MAAKPKERARTGPITKRLIGPIGGFRPDDSLEFSAAALVRRLLLFESYILDSTRLLEIPHLVRTFGPSGLKLLLSSGALKIRYDARAIAQTGQTAIADRLSRGMLPLEHVSFQIVSLERGHRERAISEKLHAGTAALPRREGEKLREAIAGAILPSDESEHREALHHLYGDLRSGDGRFATTIRRAAARKAVDIPPTELRVRFLEVGRDDFRVESNITQFTGGDQKKAHDVLVQGILAVGCLHSRIEEMRRHHALSSFLGDELPLLGERLQFLSEGISPRAPEREFARVVEIGGFPDCTLSEAQVDVARLLKLRGTSEVREFRDWLASAEEFSDSQLAELMSSLRTRVGNVFSTGVGKAIRFGVSAAAGAVGAGMVADAIDTFILDYILPSNAVVSFVTRRYPSLFDTK